MSQLPVLQLKPAQFRQRADHGVRVRAAGLVALDHSDDNAARTLVGILDASEGRKNSGVSLLAHIPFELKVSLIKDLLEAGFLDFAGDEDEQAVLKILQETLKNDPTEFFRLINAMGFETLESNIHGDEWDEFMRLLNEATAALGVSPADTPVPGFNPFSGGLRARETPYGGARKPRIIRRGTTPRINLGGGMRARVPPYSEEPELRGRLSGNRYRINLNP